MPKYTLVYFETTRIEKVIEARSLKAALRTGEKKRHEGGWWADAEEETLGTAGLQEVYDAKGDCRYRKKEESTRRAVRDELLRRFPWLAHDEPVSGANVVDALADWYRELSHA